MKIAPSVWSRVLVRLNALVLSSVLLGALPVSPVFGMGTAGMPSPPERRATPHPADRTAPSVKDIQQHADAFVGTVLTLTGRFRGWSGPCTGSPPATRSDWMFEDGTGCIYVTGALPAGLNAAVPQGEEIVVEVVVKTGADNAPYLSIRSVTMMPATQKK